MKKGLLLSFVIHALCLLWMFTLEPEDRVWNLPLGADLAQNSMQVRTLSPEDFKKELKDALEEDEAQVVAGDDQMISPDAGERSGKQLLSKHNQKVDFETRAARVGTFKNVLKEGTQDPAALKSTQSKAEPRSPEEKTSQGKPSIAKLFELTPNERDEEWKGATTRNTGRLRAPASIPSSLQSGQGFSASEDFIKDVAVGANTLLNTKEFRFYGFYERIREKLSYQWQRNLDRAFRQIFDTKKTLSNGEQTTQVQVRLKASGDVDSVRVVGSSGYSELDSAATEAFRQASPFPNPPTAMLNAQNMVQIRWDFVVLADENVGVRVRVQQTPW